jgi:hypothetical protein
MGTQGKTTDRSLSFLLAFLLFLLLAFAEFDAALSFAVVAAHGTVPRWFGRC